MRLAAQIKGGFYPAPPAAVEAAALYLMPGQPEQVTLLDPCCGKGAAVGQLAERLGIPQENIYGIELDEDRAAEAIENPPHANIVGPASFTGVGCTRRSFSLIWLNPPFDDEIGGGNRVEKTFLNRAAGLLVTGGILCLVVPEHTAGRWEFRDLLLQWFEDVSQLPFPDQCRKYDEVILFGRKRSKPIPSYELTPQERVMGQPRVYSVPRGIRPAKFQKEELTRKELHTLLRRSPLRSHLEPPDLVALPEPPLSLGKGHIALLLAAGHLDGIVCPDGEPPHVVRGVATKSQYVAGVDESENADGSVSTRTTISERIKLVVRAVGSDGHVLTLESS